MDPEQIATEKAQMEQMYLFLQFTAGSEEVAEAEGGTTVKK